MSNLYKRIMNQLKISTKIGMYLNRCLIRWEKFLLPETSLINNALNYRQYPNNNYLNFLPLLSPTFTYQ